ncbi:elongator complex protein 5 [Protopterus annectens]|uniref:elongator complex protein 5 n=1 Tax=Protopterus annectens TaxID=7888 RepID=UPI001CFA8EDB|nr:elongator complex protein 5 [Protopterus annectens]
MLQQLVQGVTTEEEFLLIQDQAECRGRMLLKSIVRSSGLRGEKVHVFGFEVSEDEFRAELPEDADSWLVFHDGYWDTRNWNQSAVVAVDNFDLHNILSHIKPSQGATEQAVAVVLDSLSWILLHKPVTTICHLLQHLSRTAAGMGLKVRRIVGLLHGDLHEPGILASICHLASTAIKVLPLPDAGSVKSKGSCGLAAVRHIKKSGKVIYKEEYFTVLENCELKFLGEHNLEPDYQEEDTDKTDPAANLTFNLHLSDQERRAKEEVPLPFHFSMEKKSSLLQSSKGQGLIYYEPDAADDIDDEDPDDDLDF